MADPIPAPTGVDVDAWNAAVGAARAYCGWHIAPSVTGTVTLDGPGGDLLMLPTLHLTALSNVTDSGLGLGFGTSTLLDTGYEWSATGMVRRNGYWSSRFRAITLTMEHGYTELPPELQALFVEAAERGVGGTMVAQVGQVRYGSSSGISGSGRFTLEQQSVLDRYRLPPRP